MFTPGGWGKNTKVRSGFPLSHFFVRYRNEERLLITHRVSTRALVAQDTPANRTVGPTTARREQRRKEI